MKKCRALTDGSESEILCGKFANNDADAWEGDLNSAELILALLDEAYEKKTWHGPNLKQSIKGITARQAAWRPGPGRHNIWEVTLHAAYWKYAVRRRIEGGKRGSFALKGSNFFERPEKGKLSESAWSADQKLLEREHRAMRATVAQLGRKPQGTKMLRQLYGVAFHDIYHAGQIRLLRRLMER
ncbi:MAG TPA: DinB family protein [Candidatus Acidoferrum sp.]|nr:DinB family protein [Candidatus Acidoferrum sp.]